MATVVNNSNPSPPPSDQTSTGVVLGILFVVVLLFIFGYFFVNREILDQTLNPAQDETNVQDTDIQVQPDQVDRPLFDAPETVEIPEDIDVNIGIDNETPQPSP